MSQRFSALAALLLIVPARQQAQQALAPIDWKQVDAPLGKAGTLQPDGAYKVGMPRSDLHVTIGGVAVKPTLALGTWGRVQAGERHEAMLMGRPRAPGERGRSGARQAPGRWDRADRVA